MYQSNNPKQKTSWNKGKLVGQKPPLKLQEVWAIRIRLQISENIRDLALFNLAIDSKLRVNRGRSTVFVNRGRSTVFIVYLFSP